MFMKKIAFLLIICLFPIHTFAAVYSDNGYFTPEQGIELVSYVALNEDNAVYNNLRDLTLLGIFRQERDFSLANYVTVPDALKLIFRCAGLEEYAYSCGENLGLRAELGISEEYPCVPGDGLYIAAYQKGLITHSRLMGYFNGEPGCAANHYAVRGEVIVWLAKLFEIAPSYDFSALERYGDTSLISSSFKPYFAAVLNSGTGLSVNGSYNPCSLIKNGDLVSLIAKFYPYILNANGITSVTSTVTANAFDSQTCTLTLSLENGDSISSSSDKPYLLVGKGFVDNVFMLKDSSAIDKKLTYFVKNHKIIFVSYGGARPERTYSETVTASLYLYDDSTGKAVFKTDNGYAEYFLDDKAEIIIGNEKVSPQKLTEYTDRTFSAELKACNSFSLKKIAVIKDV